jgi:hypothetical protein
MKGATTFIGSVKNGRLVLDNRAAFDRFTRLLDGKRVELQIRKFRKQRTVRQNNWVRGVLVPQLAMATGADPEDYDSLYMELKRKYIGVIELGGGLAVVKRGRDLSTEEYSRFMEDCQRFASELGCYVPFPDEVAA